MIAQSEAQSDDIKYVDLRINEVVIQNENKTHTEVNDQHNDSGNKKTGEMKRIITKNQRTHGEKYTGYYRKGKTMFQDIDRENKKVKPRCNSSGVKNLSNVTFFLKKTDLTYLNVFDVQLGK